MIQVIDKRNCCGCSACEQTCPKHAITMQPDKKGFSYPYVNIDKCIECGFCEQVCPILHEKEQRIPSHVYAVKNKDEKVRMKSSSGGLFSILAEDTIMKGGVVYGAAFDEDWNVRHVRIDDKQGISKLRGSKYVQSQMGDTYKMVRNDLKEGRCVLFSGTPCQVAGLHHFLGRKYNLLTTVGLVCHGVPNPRIWNDYLKEQITALRRSLGKVPFSSLKFESLIKDINFRDKSNGWEKYRFSSELAKPSGDGKQSSVFSSTYVWEHPYMLLFLKDYILRPSCHNCKFRCGRSGADYTLGDYWGIERFHEDFFDDKGVSLAMSYDRDFEPYVFKNSEVIESRFEDACYGNPCIVMNLPYNPDSSLFYFLHDRLGMNLKMSLAICMRFMCARKETNRLKQRVKRKLSCLKR